jgi:hypothetical protein
MKTNFMNWPGHSSNYNEAVVWQEVAATRLMLWEISFVETSDELKIVL